MRNKVNKGMRIVMVVVLAIITPCTVFARMSGTNEQSTSNNNSATMMSVNNSNLMQTGSSYSSDVYEVGSSSPSSTPAAAPAGKGPRKSGFNDITTGEETSEEFNNPQHGPIGDAMLPLMLMAAAFGGGIYLRRRKVAQA